MAGLKFSCSRACAIRAMVILGLCFLAYLAYRSRDALQEVVSTADKSAFVAAILLLVLANIFVSVLFAVMLGGSGRVDGARLRHVASVFLATQLGKYLPGRVWSVVAQVSTLRSAMSPSRVVIINIELAIVVVATTCGIGGALVLAHRYGLASGLLALAAAFALTASMVRLAWVRRVLAHGLSWVPALKRLAIVRDVDLDCARPWSISIIALAGFWVMYLAGWWFLVESLPGIDEVGTGLVVACLSLSYVAGLVSMLPAGLGAREAALVLLAPVSGIPFELMAMLAVSSRVALILVDGIGALVGFFAIRTLEGSRDA